MMIPACRFGWAGVFLVAGITAVGAIDDCNLSENIVCRKFKPGLQISCIKHVQLVVGFCRKSTRQERYGSHAEHCQAACRAGTQAFELDRRLRENAIATAEESSMGDETWLAETRVFWQEMGAPASVCTKAQLKRAQTDCESYCQIKARRRDLEELQGLAAGKDFLALQQPVFACPPGPATQILSGDDTGAIKHLYAPGHPRRSGAAAE